MRVSVQQTLAFVLAYDALCVLHQAAIIGEITEMYLGIQEYFQDKWNVLDMLSIILLSAGLYIRWWGNYDEDTATGKVFFALSAPLVFSRLLFFAQILRRQGLVIEVRARFHVTRPYSKYRSIMYSWLSRLRRVHVRP